MQEINKAFVYKMLHNMKAEGIEVASYLPKLVGATEIPYEVIVFINKYHPIEKLTTYNEIYMKRKNSPLFRNLMKVDLDVSEKAIILSSLLTQSLIGAKHSDDNDRDELIDAVNVDLIIHALTSYIYDHNSQPIEETFDAFQIIFKTLFPRKGK